MATSTKTRKVQAELGPCRSRNSSRPKKCKSNKFSTAPPLSFEKKGCYHVSRVSRELHAVFGALPQFLCRCRATEIARRAAAAANFRGKYSCPNQPSAAWSACARQYVLSCRRRSTERIVQGEGGERCVRACADVCVLHSGSKKASSCPSVCMCVPG